jgi:hypothetical protein
MATREDMAMKPYRFLLAALSLTMLLSGCFYVHTVEPLTVDVRRTPVAKIEKEGTMKVIAVPPIVFYAPLVAWGKTAIGEVAKQQGMKEVYYADLEVFRILWIWNEFTVHVYGK